MKKPFQAKQNTGAAFKNDREGSKAAYSGDVNVDGVMYFIDLYVNEAVTGNKYLGIKLKRKDKQPTDDILDSAPSGKSQASKVVDDFEDDVPF